MLVKINVIHNPALDFTREFTLPIQIKVFYGEIATSSAI